MKKILTLLTLLLFSVNVMMADDVSVEQALQAAQQFAIASQPGLSKVKGYRAPRKAMVPQLSHAIPSKVDEEKDNVYVINLANNQGFVIVSGESGTQDDILGYCDHGSFNYDDAPIQLKELLDNYTDEIDQLRSNPSLASKVPRKAKDIGTVVVAPLLTTTWNQWGPYNNLCPAGCPSGCVPTAFAQIMNYYKWPKESQGQLKDHMTALFTGEDFSGHVYDWDNMLDNYASGYNADQAQAVAYLMRDIGKSMGTYYQPEGSSSNFGTYEIAYNFSYEQGDIHTSQDADQLISIIKKDLDELHPVPYSGGSGDKINHALVCDGYTSNNYLHFNYGWGGAYDGFYKPSTLHQFNSKGVAITGFIPTYDTKIIEIDNIRYGLQQSGEAHIISYLLSGQNGTEINIPNTITYEGQEYPVTRIRKNAFYSRGHFSKMNLGENVRIIDQYCFIYSTIDTLVISDKMEEVPDGAFQMAKIKHLTIGASVKRIGKKAFMMCSLSNIISRSPGFEVDDEAFEAGGTGTSAGDGEWLGCITKLGYRVFASCSFNVSPHFKSLKEIGGQALYAVTFPDENLPYTYNGETYYRAVKLFHVFPSLKRIAPNAFEGTNLQAFIVEEGSPCFRIHPDLQYSKMLFSKDGSSLVVTLPQSYTTSMYGTSWYSLTLGDDDIYREYFTDNLVKLEPGSIHSLQHETFNVIIPNTVIEMKDAFTNCERLNNLTCLAVVPPDITDATFNDKIFNERQPTLYVPQGTAELYRNAPGWRRFFIKDNQKYEPVPDQGREYYMVMHRGDKSTSIPLSQVSDIRIAQDGEQNEVVVRLNGRDDLTSNVALVDSITWINGFVYENAEVFELNDSILTAEAQKCSVTFDPTTISSDLQLCIRNAVLTPDVIEGVTRGISIDISLSNNVHELSGTAKIVVPYSIGENEKVHAAYFNEETGEWEPVLASYDEEQDAVVIITDHLSYFSVFSTVNNDTWRTMIDMDYDMTPGAYDLTGMLEVLYKIVSNKDPEEGAVQAWRDDYNFWQSVGIDGGHNLLSSLGFSTEGIGELTNIVGYLGTYATILDCANASIQGDDIGVASNSLKAILSITSAQASSVIDSSVMSASMGLSAFIGVALEKLGTKVQKSIKDLLRKAYNLYYSEQGRALVGPQYGSKYRNTEEWFNYFYPAFNKHGMTKERLDAYIEQSVRRYCEAYWEEPTDVFTMCMAEADSRSMTSYQYPYEPIQKQITEEYFAELMNGELVSVFEAIKNKIVAKAAREYSQRVKKYSEWMNSYLGLKIIDSSCEEGETSQYAGWTIRYSEIPDSIKDPQNWQKTIDKDGTAKMGAFTRYSLIRHKIKSQLTLIDDEGTERATYDFEVPGGTGLQVITIDLDTGGQAIEGQGKNYNIKMDPDSVELPIYKMYGMGVVSCWGPDPELIDDIVTEVEGQKYGAFFEDWYQDIVDAFKANDGVVPSLTGDIKSNIAGLTMTGTFDTGTNTGSGTFKLNTSYHNVLATIEDLIHFYADMANWFDGNITLLWNELLEGDIHHQAEGTFTVNRVKDKYVYQFKGKGTYHLEGTVYTEVKNPGWYTKITAETDCPVTWVGPTEVMTDDFRQDGNVNIEYRLEVQP